MTTIMPKRSSFSQADGGGGGPIHSVRTIPGGAAAAPRQEKRGKKGKLWPGEAETMSRSTSRRGGIMKRASQ